MTIQSKYYLLCCFFLSHFLMAQGIEDNNISRDSIIALFGKAYTLLESESSKKINFETGIKLLDRGLRCAQEKKDSELLARALTLKAYFYAHASNLNLAEKYIKEALNYENALINPKWIGDTFNTLGIIKSYKEDRVGAIEAYLKAIKHYKTSNSNSGLLEAYHNLCCEYRYLEQFDSSISYGRKAIQLINEYNLEENRKQRILALIVLNYLDLKKPHKAQNYIEFLDKDSNNIKNSNTYLDQIYISNTKASYFFAIKDYASANYFMNKTFNILQLYLKENEDSYGNGLELILKLSLKSKQKERLHKENKLQKEQLKNRYYVLTLLGLIALSLSTYSFISKRNARKQSVLNRLIQDQYNKIEEATKITTSALKVKYNFLESFSHEFKKPLSVMKNIVNIMQSGQNTKEQDFRLKLIENSNNQLQNLINDIIDLKVLTDDRREFKKESLNLKVSINSLIEALNLGYNNNKIHKDIDDNIPKHLVGDILSLNQILNNLIKNALKFTKNGDIWIKVRIISESKNNVTINFEITDSGIGIPKEYQSKIFERFIQGSKEINRNYGGSGIGLAIVKDLIEALGSKIHLISEEGKGTSISFEIEFNRLPKNNKEAQKEAIKN